MVKKQLVKNVVECVNLPNYTKAGKIEQPLIHAEFVEGMNTGKFTRREHKGYLTLLYYSGVRRLEALRVKPEQFHVTPEFLFFDVGQRLKHSKKTPALPMNINADYMKEFLKCLEAAKPKREIFRFSYRTSYNAVARVFYYPHHFRLSRITNFFLEGYTIAEVKSWTGLTLQALDYYVGIASLIKMGKSLGFPLGVKK